MVSLRSIIGRRVLFLGDSITEDGRYISFLEYALIRMSPDVRSDIISAGLSSETVSGLSEAAHPFPRPCVHERLARALGLVRPSLTVVCYGMNDGIYHPFSEDRFAAYKDGMTRLAAMTAAAGSDLFIVTPTVFEPEAVPSAVKPAAYADHSYREPYVHYDEVLSRYAAWLRLSPPHGADVFDLHGAVTEHVRSIRSGDPGYLFTADGIHPNEAGHFAMAASMLDHLAPHGHPLRTAYAHVRDDALFKAVAERRKMRSLGWQRSIGYTRETRVQEDSIDATEIAAERMMDSIMRSVQ